MKTLYLISFLFIFLVSCQKEKEPELNPEIPIWFKPQIEELENSGDCYDCTISKIAYNNSFYFHLYCGYWSCMYCNLYDNNGNLVEWEVEDFNNFIENKNNETIIWKCGDK